MGRHVDRLALLLDQSTAILLGRLSARRGSYRRDVGPFSTLFNESQALGPASAVDLTGMARITFKYCPPRALAGHLVAER
jgi:hypothetical protein